MTKSALRFSSSTVTLAALDKVSHVYFDGFLDYCCEMKDCNNIALAAKKKCP